MTKVSLKWWLSLLSSWKALIVIEGGEGVPIWEILDVKSAQLHDFLDVERMVLNSHLGDWWIGGEIKERKFWTCGAWLPFVTSKQQFPTDSEYMDNRRSLGWFIGVGWIHYVNSESRQRRAVEQGWSSGRSGCLGCEDGHDPQCVRRKEVSKVKVKRLKLKPRR